MKRKLHIILLVGFFITLAGCGNGDDSVPVSQSGIVHPQDQWRYRPIPVTSTVSRDAPATEQNSVVASLTTEPVLTIGLLEGAEEEVFGNIEDVTLDRNNRVYVLDSFHHEVRVFDADGSFVTKVGSKGQGPGEFTSPRALTVDSQGVLYVAGLNGIHRYRWIGDVLEYDRSLRFQMEFRDLCVMENVLYVHGITMEGGEIIHRVQDDEITATFGDVYAPPNPLMGFRIKPSRLSCIQEPEVLAIGARALLGEVVGYTTNGVPEWIVRIEGFLPIESVEQSGGGSSVTIPEPGFDRLYSLTALREATLLAQVAYTSHHDYQGKAEYTELLSYLIDATTGEMAPVGKDIPRVLASNNQMYISVRRDPYPRIGIHAW